MADRRGEEIRFVAGTYVGYKGWIDNSRELTPASFPVIVHAFKKKDGSTVDKATTVRRTSVRSADISTPTSYAEAVMQQHPKIDHAMEKLCRQLAKCEMSDLGTSEYSVLLMFTAKLQGAVAKQLSLGGDAEWKRVRYAPGSEQLDDGSH
jgi:hypothetical protein